MAILQSPRPESLGLRQKTTLGGAFDPKHNSLGWLRLLLAAVVAVTHTLQLSTGHQPSLGSTQLGALAVDAFFVASGFLVAASALRLSAPRYVWHRFLRIAPAFYLCLVLTALVVAPALAVLNGAPARSVLDGPAPAITFVTDNAALLVRQFEITMPPGTPGDGVMNGALWTLFYEACCYALVLGLAVVGVLRRRRALVLVLTLAVWAATVANAAGYEVVGQENLLRLVFVFLLGVLGHLYADRVPVRAGVALTALGVLLASLLLFDDYRVLGAPAAAYLLLWAMVALPLRRQPRDDLSYGMYIYHWPVAVLLLSTPFAELPTPLVVLGVLVAAAGVALVSWRCVENPALQLKSARFPFSGNRTDDRAQARLSR
ncbi:acyltransferase family protein [Kineococcus gynurae]|uniref:Acyltransferase family protein n=1 Tax=Kineococcus gynurae TaxID=452979 RepID=A0ABV5LS38_9ACTN